MARLPGRATCVEREGASGPAISPRSEEVVIRCVAHAPDRTDIALGTTTPGGHAADGVDALNAGDLAERARGAIGLRGKQQPGDRVGSRRIGALLHRPDDLAAVVRFPVRAGV